MSSDLNERDQRDAEWLADLLDEPERAVERLDREAAEYEAGTRCEYLALMTLLAEAPEPLSPSPGLEERIREAARREREEVSRERGPTAPATPAESQRNLVKRRLRDWRMGSTRVSWLSS